MAAVVGLIELLTGTKLDREQTQMLDMAQDSAKSLLQILDCDVRLVVRSKPA